MADALDLGSNGEVHMGSSPIFCTIKGIVVCAIPRYAGGRCSKGATPCPAKIRLRLLVVVVYFLSEAVIGDCGSLICSDRGRSP